MYDFDMGDVVQDSVSGLVGEIVGMGHDDGDVSYKVRFHDIETGRMWSVWCDEGDLEAL